MLQVLIHKNTSKDREEEIVSALLILSSLFGNEKRKGVDSQIFKLFTHYHNEKHVLFEVSFYLPLHAGIFLV